MADRSLKEIIKNGLSIKRVALPIFTANSFKIVILKCLSAKVTQKAPTTIFLYGTSAGCYLGSTILFTSAAAEKPAPNLAFVLGLMGELANIAGDITYAQAECTSYRAT